MAMSISTDRGAVSAKPGANGERIDFVVKGQHGLRLRVTGDKQGNVSKIWSLLYTRKSDGKKCRVTLGEYPAMSLASASAISGSYRNQVREGGDPAGDRREGKQALTFEKLAEQWLTRHAKEKKRSWREDDRMLRHDLLPALGAIKADKVTKADVLRIVDAIHDRGAGYQANRVLVLARTIYNWGMKRDLAAANPAAHIDKPAEEVERVRKLSTEEMARFWIGIGAAPMTEPLKIALKLSLLLGQRLNEIALARKSEFNFDLEIPQWLMPGQRHMPNGRDKSGAKNKRDHLLPLPGEAVKLLRAAFDLAGDSEWVFPSPAGAGPIGDGALSRAWGRTRGGLGLSDVHAHDLRRTFATLAGSCGMNDFEIGLVLNHLSARGPVTGRIYNHADYLPEKGKVLAAVEKRLLGIIEAVPLSAPAYLK